AEMENWKRAQMGPCCTCAEPSCAAPSPSCDAPSASCCCQRCGLPVVSPEMGNDCAGTRPFKQAATKPVQQPVLATELPAMLPVSLEVGVTNSYLNESRVRRLPYEKTSPALGPCGQCQACRCGRPCQRPSCDVPQSSVRPLPEPSRVPDDSYTPDRPSPEGA